MKKSIKVTNILLSIFLLFSLMTFACGCKKDPYKGKTCIECGASAAHYASGAKPVFGNANDTNCEKITNYIYRIFYCDECWERVPKDEFNPKM